MNLSAEMYTLFTIPLCNLRKNSSCQLIYLPYSAHVTLSEISILLRKSQATDFKNYLTTSKLKIDENEKLTDKNQS